MKMRLEARLRAMAADRGLDPTGLAEAVRIPLETARKWLGAPRVIDTSASVLLRMCGYFGCSAAYMLGMTNERGSAPSRSAQPLAARLPALLSEKGKTLYGMLRSTTVTSLRLRVWSDGGEPLASDLFSLAVFLGCPPDELL